MDTAAAPPTTPQAPPTAPSRSKGLRRVLTVVVVGVAAVVYFLFMRHMQSMRTFRATQASLEGIKSAVLMYRLEQNACPSVLSALQTASPPYLMPGPLVDGWGSPFTYAPNPGAARPFSLRSAGPDRIPGTADDLDAWGMPP